MGMVWGYVFRAVLGRFGSFSVHFAHIVSARGGAGQRGYPWSGGAGTLVRAPRRPARAPNFYHRKVGLLVGCRVASPPWVGG